MDAISWRFTWHYAKSQLKLKYRYTLLGFLWNFIEPAMYLIVLSIVFSIVNRMDITDYAVFMFSALVPWRYFEKIVNACMESITGGDWLLKKIRISPFALPLSRWMIATAEFGFSLIIMLLIFLALKPDWSMHVLILPLIVIPWSLFGLGAGMIAAVGFTFMRDLKPIINMLLMISFFSAPILFKPGLFEAGTLQAKIMAWHPVSYLAALFQKPFYEGAWPGTVDWLISFALALVSLAIGTALIQKFRRHFYFYL